MDHISSLPDDLLHCILARLGSTTVAARTSLLSRRWRHVWTQLQEVVFENHHHHYLHSPAAAASVDAALARLAANNSPALNRLAITFPHMQFSSFRIAPWLAFASRRVGAGELSIILAYELYQIHLRQELKLPLMEKVTSIRISCGNILRTPSSAGSFAALKKMDIQYARMEGRDIEECFSSSRCPRLQELLLSRVRLVAVSDVSIRSESLEKLFYSVENTHRLEVVAPRLRVLRAHGRSLEERTLLAEARIVAPNLADLAWRGGYDPLRQQFVEVGRHLSFLWMIELSTIAALMRRFHTVDRLKLMLQTPRGIDGYERFLGATRKLSAKCEAMEVFLVPGRHAFAPSVLHVLRQVSSKGVRKLTVPLRGMNDSRKSYMCEFSALGCPCCLPENYMTDNVVMDSLEELMILDFEGLPHHVELLNLLLECKATKLRNLLLECKGSAPVTMETRQKIRSVVRSDINVKFTVEPHGRAFYS